MHKIGTLKRYYFTYGPDSPIQPFSGGWTIVQGIDMTERQARQIFLAVHPAKNAMIPCSMMYSEESFTKTRMYKEQNNYGKGLREVLNMDWSVFE